VQGFGVYRFANKYGANVDGYSPIYTPDVWSETGNEYKLGTKGLLAWCVFWPDWQLHRSNVPYKSLVDESGIAGRVNILCRVTRCAIALLWVPYPHEQKFLHAMISKPCW